MPLNNYTSEPGQGARLRAAAPGPGCRGTDVVVPEPTGDKCPARLAFEA